MFSLRAHRLVSARRARVEGHVLARGSAPEVLDNVVAAGVEDVVEDGERLEDVAPVLALVVEALVEHLDDLDKVGPAHVQEDGRGGDGVEWGERSAEARGAGGEAKGERTGCRSSGRSRPSCTGEHGRTESATALVRLDEQVRAREGRRGALSSARPPRIVRGGIADLDLGIRVALDRVLGNPARARRGVSRVTSGDEVVGGGGTRGTRDNVPHGGLAHALDSRHGCWRARGGDGRYSWRRERGASRVGRSKGRGGVDSGARLRLLQRAGAGACCGAGCTGELCEALARCRGGRGGAEVREPRAGRGGEVARGDDGSGRGARRATCEATSLSAVSRARLRRGVGCSVGAVSECGRLLRAGERLERVTQGRGQTAGEGDLASERAQSGAAACRPRSRELEVGLALLLLLLLPRSPPRRALCSAARSRSQPPASTASSRRPWAVRRPLPSPPCTAPAHR